MLVVFGVPSLEFLTTCCALNPYLLLFPSDVSKSLKSCFNIEQGESYYFQILSGEIAGLRECGVWQVESSVVC